MAVISRAEEKYFGELKDLLARIQVLRRIVKQVKTCPDGSTSSPVTSLSSLSFFLLSFSPSSLLLPYSFSPSPYHHPLNYFSLLQLSQQCQVICRQTEERRQSPSRGSPFLLSALIVQQERTIELYIPCTNNKMSCCLLVELKEVNRMKTAVKKELEPAVARQ